LNKNELRSRFKSVRRSDCLEGRPKRLSSEKPQKGSDVLDFGPSP
jgi:hypothetical protein